MCHEVLDKNKNSSHQELSIIVYQETWGLKRLSNIPSQKLLNGRTEIPRQQNSENVQGTLFPVPPHPNKDSILRETERCTKRPSSPALPYQLSGSAESSDDDLWVQTFLHIGFHLLQKLCSQQGHWGGAITDLEEDDSKFTFSHVQG